MQSKEKIEHDVEAFRARLLHNSGILDYRVMTPMQQQYIHNNLTNFQQQLQVHHQSIITRFIANSSFQVNTG